jgi:hypothetical protein
MPETLLTPSSIKLYGRLMRSLKYTNDTAGTGLGDNKFLQKQLEVSGKGSPNLARIYAFSFEGAYYQLPRPSIFLVHGDGLPTGNWNNNSTVDESGVAGREWDFSGYTPHSKSPGPDDLYYWEYEKGDFSIRLDLEAGPFEQILLAAALRAGADMADRATRSGASLSGASLAGASLSGASLSGASLSGASLSGASLRNGR